MKAEKVDSTAESDEVNERLYNLEEDEEDQEESDLDDEEHIEEKYKKLNFKTQHTKYRDFLGKYDDDEFYVDESLYIFFPPLRRMRPSYTLLFKLVRLSGEIKVSDKVVGWGVFPLTNSEMQVNEGKFKIPMNYGDGSDRAGKYRDIENKVKNDLDNWLCNMYFEIEPLSLPDVRVD